MKRKKYFQLPLGVMMVAMIPLAFWFQWIGDAPEFIYSENRADIVDQDDVVIDFEKDAQGVPFENRQNLNSAFVSSGVSFYNGLPDCLPEIEAGGPLYQVRIFGEDENSSIVMPEESKSGPVGKTENRIDLKEVAGNYVGATNYRFFGEVFPSGLSQAAICNFAKIVVGNSEYHMPFQGLMTVCFHQKDNPEKLQGTHRVGFFAGKLNFAGELAIRCYSLDGQLLAKQRNLSTGLVFMGFKSRRKIAWIEIEPIGEDVEYAIVGFSLGV